ncbi:MAG: threonine synthase [Candidatus Eremiobacteraeota bacterium]|nr:threonine synthase [Candidatus Eremiobacteraeota bacterium]
MAASELECSLEPAHRFDCDRLQTVCPADGAPLLVRYDAMVMPRDAVASRPWTMWRYRELLPIAACEDPVSLGEGATPLVPLQRTLRDLAATIYVKDEAQNPTASFKSRGMSAAVTVAQRWGVTSLVAPSAGNAGSALAAYAARAGMRARTYMPRDTPRTVVDEARSYGAHVELVDGLIGEAGQRAAEYARETGAFNVATFREPYRVEGKKTMAFELVEQLGEPPGTIVYPTGGGTGIVAMWKAFAELERVGWIGARRPCLVSVQAENCAPIVRAFREGKDVAVAVTGATTQLWGLRVPGGIGDRLTLRALRESGGHAVAVSDAAAHAATGALHRNEGIDATPEGGATLAALQVLLAQHVELATPIVLFNTASSLKYA